MPAPGARSVRPSGRALQTVQGASRLNFQGFIQPAFNLRPAAAQLPSRWQTLLRYMRLR